MKKIKIISASLLLVMCVALIGIGIFAAKNASLTAGGTIAFKTNDVKAEITCHKGEINDAVDTTIKFPDPNNVDSTKRDLNSNTWNVGNLAFETNTAGEDPGDGEFFRVKLSFKVKNLSSRSAYAYFTTSTNSNVILATDTLSGTTYSDIVDVVFSSKTVLSPAGEDGDTKALSITFTIPPEKNNITIADSITYDYDLVINRFDPTAISAEYNQVEYIESTGEQYIDSLFTANENTKIKVQFSTTESACGLLGFQENSIGLTLNFSSASINTRWGTFSYLSYDDCLDGNKHTIEFSKDGFYDNGVLKFTPTANNFTTGNILIGKIAGAATSGQKKIYSCKVYNNGTLARDFVPCYRKADGVIGLYDLVGNTFYTNEGTGTFTKGQNVSYIDETYFESNYTEVEYIESTGTQYIDTGFIADQNTRVIFDGAMSYATGDNAYHLFGARTGYQTNLFTFGTYSGVFETKFGNNQNTTFTLNDITTRAIIDKNKSATTVYDTDGESIYSTNQNTETFNTGVSLYIFATNSSLGNIPVGLNGSKKCYSCKIYSNGVLVRDFVPCYKTGDATVLGLYDKISNIFYSNLGTGAFSCV